MNIKPWLLRVIVFLLLTLLLAGCGSPEPVVIVVTATPGSSSAVITGDEGERSNIEVEIATTPTPAEGDTAEPAEDESAGVVASAVDILLQALQPQTEYSPRSEPFVEPATVEDIAPPCDSCWEQLVPGGEARKFQNYDSVRIREEGEATLSLGEKMVLTLKRDSVLQPASPELAKNTMDNLNIDISGAHLLDELGTALHLARGGFYGEKSLGDEPIPITTANAVAFIYGTKFAVTYDPQREITKIINFEGTVEVADVVDRETRALPIREMEIIPHENGVERIAIANELTPEEFLRLIDLVESPISAADMITGPYLVVEAAPTADVRSGPGLNFPSIGTMNEGDYARILLSSAGWWQITCPDHISGLGSECWVAAGDTADYNTDDILSVTATFTPVPTDTPTATPIPVAICQVSASSIGLWQGPGGQRGDGGLIYNRIGYLEAGEQLKISGEAYGGQWYKVQSLSTGNEGWIFASNCPLTNSGPIPSLNSFPPTLTYTPSPTPTFTPTPTYTPTPTRTPTPTNTPTPTGFPDPPVAKFSLSEDYPTVYFYNSSDNADSYFWDFGDGNTSTEENPVHTYDIPSEGTYKFTVTLTAYGPGGSDTEKKQDVIVWHIVW